MRDAMNDYKLKHICSYGGLLADAPEIIGPVPEGIRVNFFFSRRRGYGTSHSR
jgi:hypothetical protein